MKDGTMFNPIKHVKESKAIDYGKYIYKNVLLLLLKCKKYV